MNFLELINSVVPDMQITVIILVIGIFSITSNAIGINTFNKNNIKKGGNFVYLVLVLILSIVATLLGLYGVYHNMSR